LNPEKPPCRAPSDRRLYGLSVTPDFSPDRVAGVATEKLAPGRALKLELNRLLG